MQIGVIALGRRGAAGPFSLELSRHLHAHARVFALIASQSESLSAWEASGMDIQAVSTYQTTPQALLSYFQAGRFQKIAEWIRAQGADVLVFPFFYTWNPFIQAQLPEIPAVVVVHDPIPHPGLASFAYRLLEDASIRRADRCLVLSQSLRQALVRRGARPDQIDHIPHGGLSSYYQSVASPPPKADQPVSLLFFGRITRYKGLEILLQAFRQIKTRFDVRLRVVGSGDLAPYLSLLKNSPEIEVVNRWIGEEEVGEYFSQAHILVLPYTSASQSGVVAVAAGFGLPVVATRVGGLPEQVRDGETGLLVEPGSVDQLASALERLLLQPALRVELGRSLQRDFQENRNWATIAALVYESCRRAVVERQRSTGA